MAIIAHAPIILASGSTIRQQMLKSVGLPVSVEPSGVDEESLSATLALLPIPQRALALAKAKALAVSEKHPGAYVIGADQMCALGDTILNKPGSYESAEAQLASLAGNTHVQNCGTVIAKDGAILWEHLGTAKLTLRPLSREDIRSYIQADAPLSSCGSYKFESLGRHLFSTVEGDHDIIKGLPLQPLLNELHARGVIGFAAV